MAIEIDSLGFGVAVIASSEIEFRGEIESVAFFCKVFSAKIELAEFIVQFALFVDVFGSFKNKRKFPALSVQRYLR